MSLSENGTGLDDSWEENAIYVLGIALHPLGEIDSITFLMQGQGNLEEVRLRCMNIVSPGICPPLAAYLFAHNAVIAAKQLYRQHTLLPACCLIQALAGVAYVITQMMYLLSTGATCRHVVWAISFGICVSNICICTVLLQKAYIVCDHNRWLLVLGVVLLLPQPLITYYFWVSPSVMLPKYGCTVDYPKFLPWLKLVVDLLINLAFSSIFIAVIYRLLRQLGSAAWKKLVQDGIRTMCAIILSNVVCMLGVAFEVLGPHSDMCFIIDWIIASILLVDHISGRKSVSPKSSHHKKRVVLNGFSQLESTNSHIPDESVPSQG